MAVVWEDARHLAFLSRRPNTLGFTVVLPKAHFPSYVFDLPDDDLHALVDAARTVARMLDRHFADVGRTGLILEGFGVDHAHAEADPDARHGRRGGALAPDPLQRRHVLRHVRGLPLLRDEARSRRSRSSRRWLRRIRVSNSSELKLNVSVEMTASSAAGWRRRRR